MYKQSLENISININANMSGYRCTSIKFLFSDIQYSVLGMKLTLIANPIYIHVSVAHIIGSAIRNTLVLISVLHRYLRVCQVTSRYDMIAQSHWTVTSVLFIKFLGGLVVTIPYTKP